MTSNLVDLLESDDEDDKPIPQPKGLLGLLVENDSETPINFDSDDEDKESTPQPKTQNPKPVKETPLPKPYKPYFLPVIISSQLSKEKKNKLISVLKKHKQAFAWKMTDIPGICPSFCKHKIQLLDDKELC
ncbi:hypothetical protein Tco_0292939 [Tanacetum coccineum]